MNILITGGLGFIGTHTVNLLSQKPNTKITVVDNMTTNCSFASSLPTNFLLKQSCCRFLPIDISEPDFNFRSLCSEDKYDCIYHYAGPVGPAGILKHAGTIGQQIVNGINNMISVALKYDAELIFISTSEVYGFRKEAILLTEDSDKMLSGAYSVRNEYAQAKLLAEIILSNTAKVKPLKYQIFRPFNVCGPYQQPGGGFVIPRMVISALKGEDITVFGDGYQVRSFIHAQDVVEGIETIKERGKQNEIWNLGNIENTINIRNLAKMIVEITESSSRIIYVDPKEIWGSTYEEAWNKIPDTRKATTLAKWTATRFLTQIIEETIEYWKPYVHSRNTK